MAESATINHAQALNLIYMLFLKGAANKGVPDSLSTSIVVESKKVTITKGDLMSAYKLACRNSYLHRLAEFLASNISKFAESNGWSGDI